MKYTFKREERLKSRKLIELMFKKGDSFGMYPLRLVWMEAPSSPLRPPQRGRGATSELPPFEGAGGIQFAVSVPKRRFKSAVDRNRIKRKVREAWRLNKPWLYEHLEGKEKRFAFMVLYTGKEDFSYQEIEAAMRRLNRKFLATAFSERKRKTQRPANPKPE